MDILDVSIQIISLLTTIVGIYFVSEKKKCGFLLYIVSLMCQAFLFGKNSYWFLLFQMLVLIVCNLLTYLKWKKGEINEY